MSLSKFSQRYQTIASERLYRLNQVVGKEGLIPISPSNWYSKIAAGNAPKPVKIGTRVSAWRGSDLISYINALDTE